MTDEEITTIAHRTASKYTHRSDPAFIAYTFLPHTLLDFSRRLIESATAAERERCAELCDALCDDHWSQYKGTPPNEKHPARGNPYTEGVSDGASLCAAEIRRGE